ncbi:hypothetical protein ABZW44_36305 [Streptomyces mirabilis]|uniref:hypothetical protein n=1 Tax=Streptomyces mirabilis TaxID=68239 RepID=UPI0033B890E1
MGIRGSGHRRDACAKVPAQPLNAAVCEDRRARRASASRVIRRTTSPAGRISWEVFFFEPLRRPHRERLHGGRRFGLRRPPGAPASY